VPEALEAAQPTDAAQARHSERAARCAHTLRSFADGF
jgi:hypothetical protein